MGIPGGASGLPGAVVGDVGNATGVGAVAADCVASEGNSGALLAQPDRDAAKISAGAAMHDGRRSNIFPQKCSPSESSF